MIAIIKYNAGNTTSLRYALQRIGADAIITDHPAQIIRAEKVIFPGVGEASSAMNYLVERGLDNTIRNLTQPVLGICLGMQLLCNYSRENNTQGLCIFNSVVQKFPPLLKVPHVGWNKVREKELQYDAYFVHSYYAELCTETTAETNYMFPFSATLQKDNFYGVQFHPEKSASAGERYLKQFLSL
jgi:imidazole glycerol-phosphate synthase subunit HisH